MITYGPVPSRRLGKSMGINNIPPKICTYSCAYCQVGRTLNIEVEPRPFYEPEELVQNVKEKVAKARDAGEPIDYLSFVPDGEPTLDSNLGEEIRALEPIGIKRAVITNASLLWREEVRKRLLEADWVSVKVDSVDEKTWRRVNHPARSLELDKILEGITAFSEIFKGELASETMLVEGINDSVAGAEKVGEFLSTLDLGTAYISIPTRPPADDRVHPPREEVINRYYQIVNSLVDDVEYLIGYEGNAFAFTGDVREDLLSITAVHPMREEAVEEFLGRAEATWMDVENLINKEELKVAEYDGNKYFMRALSRRSQP
ncbi:MAG: radical SAM protein [Planctomycetes bacterium]|nr:radical SAM protein [Planctomycetota bacterium]